MHSHFRPLLLLIPLLLISCSEKEQLFTLVDSQTHCSIVMELGPFKSALDANNAYSSIDWFDDKHQQDNICQTALAALELQEYLSFILNIPKTHLPIVDIGKAPQNGSMIILGQPAHPEFKKIIRPVDRYWRKTKSASDQALRIDSFYSPERRGMVLSGKTTTGILYAVYELLSRYGVRWFTPEKGGEFIPRMGKIDIFSIHEFYDPAMKIRGFWMDARRTPLQGDIDLFKWMGRNRINLYWNHEQDVPALKQRGILLNTGRQDLISTLIKPEYNYRYNHPNFSNDEHYPMDPFMVSDSFHGDLNNDQMLSYIEAHPEWFDASIDSVETGQTGISTPHICLSNLNAVREFSQIIVDKLRYGEWQTCDIIDVWEPENWCACPKCRQMGNNADKLLYMMYNVNKAIAAAHEDGTLNRPIYVHGYVREFAAAPPSIKLPKDFDDSNMAVHLFTGARCYNHYIISPGCTEINIWFSRSLLEWRSEKAIYTGPLYIAENYNADYMQNLPATHSEMMRLDIPAYSELGASGINFQHVRIRNNGVQKLLNYQFARQSWEKDVSVDTLRNEFFAYYYKSSADLVRQYYERLELAMATISTWAYYLPRHTSELLSTEDNEQKRRTFIIDEKFAALDSVNGVNFSTLWENTYANIFEARHLMEQIDTLHYTPVIKSRIEDLKQQLEYTELVVNLYDNIISYITSQDDEDYIQEEAIIRMKENKSKLLALPIISSLQGATNAYESCGVKHIVEILNKDFEKK